MRNSRRKAQQNAILCQPSWEQWYGAATIWLGKSGMGRKGMWVVEKAAKAQGVCLTHLTCVSLKQRSKVLSLLAPGGQQWKEAHKVIFLSPLPWAGASRKLWQLLSVVLWEFLQHRVLVSLPQLDDTRPVGDNEPYKEKWRCKNKMKSKRCSFAGHKAFTDVKSCSPFHLRCVLCPKRFKETTNSPGRSISWPESQNINWASLSSKTAPLFPFVLFLTATATPPFSAGAGRALCVTPSQPALSKGTGKAISSERRRELEGVWDEVWGQGDKRAHRAGVTHSHVQDHCASPTADGAAPDFYSQRM